MQYDSSSSLYRAPVCGWIPTHVRASALVCSERLQCHCKNVGIGEDTLGPERKDEHQQESSRIIGRVFERSEKSLDTSYPKHLRILGKQAVKEMHSERVVLNS